MSQQRAVEHYQIEKCCGAEGRCSKEEGDSVRDHIAMYKENFLRSWFRNTQEGRLEDKPVMSEKQARWEGWSFREGKLGGKEFCGQREGHLADPLDQALGPGPGLGLV